ncbi:sulfate permease family domain-containing protein [Phthorimaea operculella]|nr:sulfate permease family domain-containing protein [Phthorimaea operculella]
MEKLSDSDESKWGVLPPQSQKGGKWGRLKALARARLPILTWAPLYDRETAAADLVAGVTLGLTLVPQSIAYASLADLPVQYGLYSSFIGTMLYVFLGTVKEVSIGPTSLMALLTLQTCQGLPIQFVVLLTFLSGAVVFAMGLLKLGFMVDLISPSVTSGFTSATAVIIVAAQLKGLLGVSFVAESVVDNLALLVQKAGDVRLGDSLLSLGCCTVLLSLRKLKDVPVSPKRRGLKRALWLVSIARNAIVVCASSVLAYCTYDAQLNQHPYFKLSGNILTSYTAVLATDCRNAIVVCASSVLAYCTYDAQLNQHPYFKLSGNIHTSCTALATDCRNAIVVCASSVLAYCTYDAQLNQHPYFKLSGQYFVQKGLRLTHTSCTALATDCRNAIVVCASSVLAYCTYDAQLNQHPYFKLSGNIHTSCTALATDCRNAIVVCASSVLAYCTYDAQLNQHPYFKLSGNIHTSCTALATDCRNAIVVCASSVLAYCTYDAQLNQHPYFKLSGNIHTSCTALATDCRNAIVVCASSVLAYCTYDAQLNQHPYFKLSGNIHTSCTALATDCRNAIVVCASSVLAYCTYDAQLNQHPYFKLSGNIHTSCTALATDCRNAIVVCASSVLAYCTYDAQLNQHPYFKLSGRVEPGLPPVSAPPFSVPAGNGTEALGFLDMTRRLSSAIVMLPIVMVLANIAIAKAFKALGFLDMTRRLSSAIVMLPIVMVLANIAIAKAFSKCGLHLRLDLA